ncbi:DUF1759 domain-containing protein, partial [Acinetobacter baumannii]|uniref:DUF1759 domain-containing protein n=1 Tax=Acinetobacter baumannii TaxID=470 RepID=UPI0011778B6A
LRKRKHLQPSGFSLQLRVLEFFSRFKVGKIFERLEKLYGNTDNVYTSLLNELLAVKNPSLENPASFIRFSNALHDLIDNMTMLNQGEYLNDQRLLKDLVARLPVDLRNKWLSDS